MNPIAARIMFVALWFTTAVIIDIVWWRNFTLWDLFLTLVSIALIRIAIRLNRHGS